MRFCFLFAALVAIVAAAGGCTTPPEAATAEVQALLEVQQDALGRAQRNAARSNETWAEKVRELAKAGIDKDVERKVRAESQPTADWILSAFADRDARLTRNEQAIAEALAKLKDENLGVALEVNGAALDYVREVSERQRRFAQIKALIGIKAKAEAVK